MNGGHLLFLVVFLSPAIHAVTWFVGYHPYYRDYQESVTPPGRSHEYGFLSGLNLGFISNYDQVDFTAQVEVSRGVVIYDGSIHRSEDWQFLRFTKHKTLSMFLELDTQMGVSFYKDPWRFRPFFGLGYKTWWRQLESDRFWETYHWPYASIGFGSYYRFSNHWEMGLVFTARATISSTMRAANVPEKFLLGEKMHFIVEWPFIWQGAKSEFINGMTIVPYYSREAIGRSQNIPNPDKPGWSWVEPDSRTHLVGLKFRWLFSS